MSELISGKEALIALANGETIQAQYRDHAQENCWFDILNTDQLSIFDRDDLNFRLKKQTITLNGIEVPAPFRPKEDCLVYIIDDGKTCNYRQYDYEFGVEDESNWIGIWRTKEEIKQVVAALRQIFKP